MGILFFLIIFYSYANVIAAKNDSPQKPTAPKFFALLEKMKTGYNHTWKNLKMLNGQLNDHFRRTKDSKIKKGKRLAFSSASFTHPNICPCILRRPCVTKQVSKEPLDENILQEYSMELDASLKLYLNDFDPRIFDNTAFSQNDNKFVNPQSLQKRLFISNNPTFVYLEKNASATLLCPKFSSTPYSYHMAQIS